MLVVDCDDDDEVDATVAINETRVCEYLLGRRLEQSQRNRSHIDVEASNKDLLPAACDLHAVMPATGRLPNMFELCQVLALPFLDEMRTELAKSLATEQLATAPVLDVNLEEPTEEMLENFKRLVPQISACPGINIYALEVFGEQPHGLAKEGYVAEHALVLPRNSHDNAAMQLSKLAESRLKTRQMGLLFDPGSLWLEDTGCEVQNEHCSCFGILIGLSAEMIGLSAEDEEEETITFLLVVIGKCCPATVSTSCHSGVRLSHCLALLDCSLTPGLRIAAALAMPQSHCPRLFWQQEVLRGEGVSNLEPCAGRVRSFVDENLLQSRCAGLNPSQRSVVETLVDQLCGNGEGTSNSRMALIQGPPGTGKTQTLAAFMDLMLECGQRTLVCAPSNVAVGELTERLLKKRMFSHRNAEARAIHCFDEESDMEESRDCTRLSSQQHQNWDVEGLSRCLRPGEWLDDACLRFCLQSLLVDIPDEVMLVEPAVAYMLQVCDNYWERFLHTTSLNLSERQLILLPVNDAASGSAADSGTHWSLLCVRRSSRAWTFELYDSLPSCPSYPVASRLAGNVSSVLHQDDRFGDDPAPVQLRAMTTARQSNGNDCGIFLLSYVDKLLHAFPGNPSSADLLAPVDADQLRARFSNLLGAPSSGARSVPLTAKRSARPVVSSNIQMIGHKSGPDMARSSAYFALVASDSTANIDWADVRSTVLLSHRAKRIRRAAQFWLGERRSEVVPFLEQPPWTWKNTDPLSALLLNPDRAWAAWCQRPVQSAPLVGALSPAWTLQEGRPEMDQNEFFRFAVKALHLVADRQLGLLWSDIPDDVAQMFPPGPDMPKRKWIERVQISQDMIKFREALMRLCHVLQEASVQRSCNPEPDLSSPASSPTFSTPVQARRRVPCARADLADDGSSNCEEVNTSQQDHSMKRRAMGAVVSAARGNVDELLEILELTRGANQNALHDALRKLKLLVHPDKAPGRQAQTATIAFQHLDDAWSNVQDYCCGRAPHKRPTSKPSQDASCPSPVVLETLFGKALVQELWSALVELQKVALFVRLVALGKIEGALVQHCTLIFCTLSISGRPLVREQALPNLVIDEACQCGEALSLVPLHTEVTNCVLVGDPQQLPATVQSKLAQRLDYGRSTFERLLLLHREPRLLNIQYRMHPDILAWPNKEFYGDQVITDPSVMQRDTQCWLQMSKLPGNLKSCFGPTRIFDTSAWGWTEQSGGHSWCNPEEAKFLLDTLQAFFSKSNPSDKLEVGIITPYRAQVKILDQMLSSKGREWVRAHAHVSTVDGFQGKERHIIAISTVRTGSSIGFLRDYRRLNVAITRAKFGSWIFGDLCALEHGDKVWKSLADFCRQRGWVVDARQMAAARPAREKAELAPGMRTAPSTSSNVSEASIAEMSPQQRQWGERWAVWEAKHDVIVHSENRTIAPQITMLHSGNRCLQAGPSVHQDRSTWMPVVTLDAGAPRSIEGCSGWIMLDITADMVSNLHLVANSKPISRRGVPGNLGMPRRVDPFDICFTHDSISSKFRSGTPVDEAIRGVLAGLVSVTNFPPLCVTENPEDDRLYSLSNRRLFMCRVLANQGAIRQVDVVVYPFSSRLVRQKWPRSFSTCNGGIAVRVASDFIRDQWPRRPQARTPMPEPSPQPPMNCRGATLSEVERGTEAPQAHLQRVLHLQVPHPELGAGIELRPTRWGMLVDGIEPEPGQPGLEVGDAIIRIADRYLLDLEEEALQEAFKEGFGHGAQIEVLRMVTKELGALHACTAEIDEFDADLAEFAKLFDIEAWVEPHAEGEFASVWVQGLPDRMPLAQAEMTKLLKYYTPKDDL